MNLSLDDGTYYISRLDLVRGLHWKDKKRFHVRWLSWDKPTLEYESTLEKDEGARSALDEYRSREGVLEEYRSRGEYRSRTRMYHLYHNDAVALRVAEGDAKSPKEHVEYPARLTPEFWAETGISYLDLAAWNWWDKLMLQRRNDNHRAAAAAASNDDEHVEIVRVTAKRNKPAPAAAAAAASSDEPALAAAESPEFPSRHNPVTPARRPPTPSAPRRKRVAAAAADSDTDEDVQRAAPKAARRLLPSLPEASSAADADAAAAALRAQSAQPVLSGLPAAAPVATDAIIAQAQRAPLASALDEVLESRVTGSILSTFRVMLPSDALRELNVHVATFLSKYPRPEPAKRLLVLLAGWLSELAGPEDHELSRGAYQLMRASWQAILLLLIRDMCATTFHINANLHVLFYYLDAAQRRVLQ